MAARLGERFTDMATLARPPGFVQGAPYSLTAIGDSSGKIARSNPAMTRTGDRQRAHHVLQLAVVPRPRIAHQRLDQFGVENGRVSDGSSGLGPETPRQESHVTGRPLNGAAAMRTTSSRYQRSRRNRPASTSSASGRFVAAMTRTSTRLGLFSPRRRISPSCRVRSSFACARADNSATSSRKTAPVSASSNKPRRSRTAPVKAPRANPNNSASKSSSVTAAQLSEQSGRAARGLNRRTALATNSLPLPPSPSPSTRTGYGAVAASRMVCRSSRITELSPAIPKPPISSWFIDACSRSPDELRARLPPHPRRKVAHRAAQTSSAAQGGANTSYTMNSRC